MNKIYAHRGMSNIYIPNSIDAIKYCVDKKYIDGIEIDVRMTKDEKFILFHDKKLDGHCSLNGKIFDYNLCELKQIDFKLKRIDYYHKLFETFNKKCGKTIRKNIRKMKNKSYRIVTLNDVLSIIGDKELLIEIKCENENEFNIYKFYNIIKLYTGKKILIQSFNKGIIDKLKLLDNNLNLGLLLTINNKFYNYYYNFYSLEYLLITKRKIDSSIIRKKIINLWTVNYHNDLDKISKITGGKIFMVNYISDNPDLIYKSLKNT